MQAESDCVIELPYPAADALMRRQTARRSAEVLAAEPVAERVVRLAVRFAEGRPTFLPGQYVKIAVPGAGAWRSYSFANAPAEDREAEFFIRVLDQGVMSEYVAGRVAVGGMLEIEGAFGHFYLRPSPRPVLMVAGGTGLAPMLSMLEHMSRTGHHPSRLSLLYGVNRADEFFALERLEAHATKLGLDVRLAAVEGGGPSGTRAGVVTDLLDGIADASERDAYLCGPPGMIVAAQTRLQQAGVPSPRIYAEKFLPSG
jgi:NAD(P)H-flavin reductase